MNKELRKELEEKANELFEIHKNNHPKDMREDTLQIKITGRGIILWYTGYRKRIFYDVYWERKLGDVSNAFDIGLLRQNASAILSYKDMIDNKDFEYFTEEELRNNIILTQKELKNMKEKYQDYFGFVDYHHIMMVESALEISLNSKEEEENKKSRLEILELELMTDDEKDFTRKFENLLKSKGLKIISFIRNDEIRIKNTDFPYCMEKKFINSKIKYLLNDKTLITLKVNKGYIDNMAQYFSIENIKIENQQ